MAKFIFETDGTIAGTKIKIDGEEVQNNVQTLYLDYYMCHDGMPDVRGSMSLNIPLGNGLVETKNLILKVEKPEDED